ncbi:MAG: hypothetical protein M0P97_00840 [Candidatus Moranbacteria bacterium]|jgi:hypothetical protein|nr:hypothetical protein [Candidatus Moranbacteria bacterium]
MYKFGSVQQKILLTLMGGVALGCASSPRQYFKTLRQVRREWKNIDQRNFNRSIRTLSREKLIKENELPDGSFELVLTARGKIQARKLDFLGGSIMFKKPKRWDSKWRVVLFDVPEKDRLFRDILREHLHNLKFRKLQHSVFVSPYPCEKSILELTALYGAERYVRVITATKIDNEAVLKKHFSKLI